MHYTSALLHLAKAVKHKENLCWCDFWPLFPLATTWIVSQWERSGHSACVTIRPVYRDASRCLRPSTSGERLGGHSKSADTRMIHDRLAPDREFKEHVLQHPVFQKLQCPGTRAFCTCKETRNASRTNKRPIKLSQHYSATQPRTVITVMGWLGILRSHPLRTEQAPPSQTDTFRKPCFCSKCSRVGSTGACESSRRFQSHSQSNRYFKFRPRIQPWRSLETADNAEARNLIRCTGLDTFQYHRSVWSGVVRITVCYPRMSKGNNKEPPTG